MYRWGLIVCVIVSCLISPWRGAEAQEAPATAEPAEALVTGAPQVRLIEPGAEPRRELRYAYTVGHQETLQMDMDMRMRMQLGVQGMPEVDLPTMRMLMTITGTEVTPEGSLRYQFQLASADVVDEEGADPMVTAELRSQLALLAGLSGWAVVDRRGFTLDGGVDVPSGANAQVQQLLQNMEESIQQMSAPFPEEPVGVGARWEVTSSMSHAGFTFNQTANYTLAQLEGDTGRLDVTVSQVAPSQPITSPDIPPGAEFMLELFNSNGSGTAEFDLTKLVPRSEMSMTTQMNSLITASGQSQRMSMEMNLGLTIAPAP